MSLLIIVEGADYEVGTTLGFLSAEVDRLSGLTQVERVKTDEELPERKKQGQMLNIGLIGQNLKEKSEMSRWESYLMRICIYKHLESERHNCGSIKYRSL